MDKPTDLFYWKKYPGQGGESVLKLTARCKKCHTKRCEQRRTRDRASSVLKSLRGSDSRAGRVSDISLEYVREMIQNPCTYCGTVAVTMTLDRIDNSLGHIRGNLNASCVRCNSVRGNMPYGAWLVLAEGMGQAEAQGLFGKWIGRVGTCDNRCHPLPETMA